jgi:hypothetical protein
MIHIDDTPEFRNFLVSAGIRVTDISHNSVTLKNRKTGETITLFAEVDYGVCNGIPGIYVSKS